MRREDMADLTAFVVVAEEGSFTRAARRLNLSQPALSQIVRRLEERLGLRLLARTTRSVATTEAGERLVQSLAPMLRDMDQRIADLSELRDRPMGTVRLTSVEHAARTVVGPRLAPMLAQNPDVIVEVIVDYGLTDVVAERFDAGVRLGEQVDKDMISLRLSPPVPMAIVGAPAYLAEHGEPTSPEALSQHRGVNLRLPSSQTLYAWPLAREGRALQARLDSAVVFNTMDLIVDAALAGLGLAYAPLDMVQTAISQGRLAQVLKAWTPSLPPYHLYYPSRRHMTPAFRLVVDALRERPGRTK